MINISIGFSTNKTAVLSKIICLAQRTPYSHVYIRVDSKYGEYVYQASGLAVNFTNIDTFLEHNKIIEEYQFSISEEQKTKLLTLFVKYCGRPYGLKSLLKIAWMMISKKKLKGDGDETFVCSELGAVIVESILGIEIKEDQDYITPRDLHGPISQNGARII